MNAIFPEIAWFCKCGGDHDPADMGDTGKWRRYQKYSEDLRSSWGWWRRAGSVPQLGRIRHGSLISALNLVKSTFFSVYTTKSNDEIRSQLW